MCLVASRPEVNEMGLFWSADQRDRYLPCNPSDGIGWRPSKNKKRILSLDELSRVIAETAKAVEIRWKYGGNMGEVLLALTEHKATRRDLPPTHELWKDTP